MDKYVYGWGKYIGEVKFIGNINDDYKWNYKNIIKI